MNIETHLLFIIALVTFMASFVQSVTGFGFGIVAMIFLPYIFPLYTEANVLSSILSAVTSALVLIVMHRSVDWKNLIFPLIGNFFANYFATTFLKSAKNDLLILLLGIVLFLLSIYFFFFSSKIRIRPTWYAGLTAGCISGVMSGLFAIGGPPVVIYFMQSEKNTDGYLATISAYFVFSGVITVSMKALSGFVTINVLVSLILGLIGMLIGSFIGKAVRSKIKPAAIKKAVYLVMAVSGLVNIVSSIA